MTFWHVVQTTQGKEKSVASQLERQGAQTFMPEQVRSVAISRHTKRRKLFVSPLIPRVVLAKLPEQFVIDSIRHARRYATNVSGEPLMISGPSMAKFMETHQAWLKSEMSRLSDEPKDTFKTVAPLVFVNGYSQLPKDHKKTIEFYDGKGMPAAPYERAEYIEYFAKLPNQVIKPSVQGWMEAMQEVGEQLFGAA